MCEVKSIFNIPPITTVSDDPCNLEPLTPNHLPLLKGEPPLPPDVSGKNDSFARRKWKQVRYLADVFWRKWSREYLPLLQGRQTWLRPRRDLETGDVVLVLAENTPRCHWPLGRVVEVFPDKKGFVRRVKVLVKTGVLERPIDKLCLLVEGNTALEMEY